jgi:hypothetical protein
VVSDKGFERRDEGLKVAEGVHGNVLLPLDEVLLPIDFVRRRRECETTRYMRLSGGNGGMVRGSLRGGRISKKERGDGDPEKCGNGVKRFNADAAGSVEDVVNPAGRLPDGLGEVPRLPVLGDE